MTSPFELRYAILHSAKDMLEAQYKANLSAWEAVNKTSKDALELAPKFPTVEEVIQKAIELNKFVSDSNERELAKVAKRITGMTVAF